MTALTAAFLAHLHKLDTMNRFIGNLFTFAFMGKAENRFTRRRRDKTDKRDNDEIFFELYSCLSFTSQNKEEAPTIRTPDLRF